MIAFKDKLQNRILIPIIFVGIIGMFCIFIIIKNQFSTNVIKTAETSASQIIDHFRILRSYYTKNVVGVVKRNTELDVAFDHKNNEMTIPLPASMIHDLSAEINSNEGGVKLKLYSEFPFPNRKDRVLDTFAKDAVNQFNSDKNSVFKRQEKLDGKTVLRYAIPDLMAANACVDCHNTHPDTPKDDWELGDVRGVLEVIMPIENALATGIIASNIAAGSVLLFLGISFFIVLFIINHSVLSPIKDMTKFAQNLNEGDGDLTYRLPIKTKGEIAYLASVFNNFIDKIQTMILHIFESGKSVGVASEQISTSSEEMASGAEEQQAQLSEIASAIEEMTAMIIELSRNSTTAHENAEKSNTRASAGRSAVNDVVQGIDKIVNIVNETAHQISELEGRSGEINEVIKVIDEIADQTNLLALNANIEAARAGDAGRGFAVVADEVRKLAERTIDATSDIENRINQIQAEVNTAVKSMIKIKDESGSGQDVAKNADAALGKIDVSSKEVKVRVIEIADAAEEQSSSAEEISKNVEMVATVSKESASGAQQLASSAQMLNEEVENMNSIISRFKVK